MLLCNKALRNVRLARKRLGKLLEMVGASCWPIAKGVRRAESIRRGPPPPTDAHKDSGFTSSSPHWTSRTTYARCDAARADVFDFIERFYTSTIEIPKFCTAVAPGPRNNALVNRSIEPSISAKSLQNRSIEGAIGKAFTQWESPQLFIEDEAPS